MPVPKGTRYRVKTTPSRAKIRLAFHKGKVIEHKKLTPQKPSGHSLLRKSKRKK